MPKNFIIKCLIIFNWGFAQSQDNSLLFLTNFYINQQNWEQLDKLENKIIQSNQADLLAMLGKAYYYKNNLHLAEKFYNKSHEINKNREIDIEYFLTLFLQGHVQEANLLRAQMSTLNLQYANIHYPLKTISLISLDSGIKQIKEKEIGENMLYASLTMGINITSQMALELGFSNINQKINQGKLMQNEAHIGSKINVKNYFSVLPAFHYTKTNFDGLSNLNNYEGTSKNYIASVCLSKRFYNFSIMPHIGYILGETKTIFVNPNFDTNFSQNSEQMALQYGLTLSYKLKLSNHLYWTLTPSYYFINQNNSTKIIDESFETNDNESIKGRAVDMTSILYFKKFTLGINYVSKDDVLFATNQSKYFYNFPGSLKYNLSSTLGFNVLPKFSLYLTFQKEQNLRRFDQQSINYNNYFLTFFYQF